MRRFDSDPRLQIFPLAPQRSFQFGLKGHYKQSSLYLQVITAPKRRLALQDCRKPHDDCTACPLRGDVLSPTQPCSQPGRRYALASESNQLRKPAESSFCEAQTMRDDGTIIEAVGLVSSDLRENGENQAQR
jgi:hypothetical protein